MEPLIIVLDINGVLADVRKKCDPAPGDVPVDLVIPSGQKVYLRPHLDELFNFLGNMKASHPGLRIAMWTSRKAVNAEPIEERIRKDHEFVPEVYMHGEDCKEYQGFHPLKDSRILRSRMHLGGRDRVVFIDDSPERIKLDRFSQVLPIQTFSAGQYGDNELIKTVCSVYRMLTQQ